MLSNAENGSELLIAFLTSIVVARHPLFLLSLLKRDFSNYLTINQRQIQITAKTKRLALISSRSLLSYHHDVNENQEGKILMREI
jgi:hypothetical protein